jgi:hypothetical protein
LLSLFVVKVLGAKGSGNIDRERFFVEPNAFHRFIENELLISSGKLI